MFKRKLYNELLKWKNETPKTSALLIEGARRVGKTTLVKGFAEKEYEDYIYVDFTYESDEMKELFNNLKDIERFYRDFFLLAGKTLKKGGLIIFDEIQFCPKARQGIKRFVEDGRYDFIETGSLLSIRDNTSNIMIPSEEKRLELFPLDFEEFLWAFDDDNTPAMLRDIFAKKETMSSQVHEAITKKFREYMALGGMPKVISIFKETSSYVRANEEKKDIIKLYKDDLLKHDRKYNTHTREYYDSLISQLLKGSTRFQITNTNLDKRNSQLRDTLFDIQDSKICNVVYEATDTSLGFELSKNEEKYKIYPNDTGLIVTSIYAGDKSSEEDTYKKIVFGKLNSNFGIIFESLVAQSLTCYGIKPYYHTFTYNEKKYEIDFLIQLDNKACAIEVKSGSNFTTKSLDVIKLKYHQNKIESMLISNKPFGVKDDIVSLPIYMMFCLN